MAPTKKGGKTNQSSIAEDVCITKMATTIRP